MAWTAPMTASDGTAFTAAQWNAQIRDNLAISCPGVATTAGAWVVGNGANALVERVHGWAQVTTGQTTTSTSYADLTTTGPAVTLTTGTKAIVSVWCGIEHATTGSTAFMSFAVSGATTTAASDPLGIRLDGRTANNYNKYGASTMVTLTAGSNTFTAKYKVGSGTGNFFDRKIAVWVF